MGTKTFKASYSATANRWHVSLEWHVNSDKIEFDVRYISIAGFDSDRRLASTVQKLDGKNVVFEWTGYRLIIKEWTKLDKKGIELFNPDMPRNLAKSVTVR